MRGKGDLRSGVPAGSQTHAELRLASYTFTGQFSYLDDPTTAGITEGFGLMYYNARYYSPYINHFIQPDGIIPEQTQGVQAWDRYAYANNNPVRFTDPSGHMISQGCGDDGKGSCRADPNTHEESDNIQHLASLVQDVYENKCAAGSQAYCDGDPVEIAAFTLTMWTGGALLESAILGGGAADVTVAAFWKGILACARSVICFRAAVGLGILDYYPPNRGFAFDPVSITLQPGQILVRNGTTSGQYASPIGTSISARALPFGVADTPLSGFEVLKPIENVLSGPIQGWFGQAGGGIQYYLGVGGRTIQSLIDSEHLGPLP